MGRPSRTPGDGAGTRWRAVWSGGVPCDGVGTRYAEIAVEGFADLGR